MTVRVRLQRLGRRNRPFYRVVVADSRAPRNGKFIELVGTYNPLATKSGVKEITFKVDRIRYWVSVGAQPSDRVAWLLGQFGILPRKIVPMGQTKQNMPRKEWKELQKQKAVKGFHTSAASLGSSLEFHGDGLSQPDGISTALLGNGLQVNWGAGETPAMASITESSHAKLARSVFESGRGGNITGSGHVKPARGVFETGRGGKGGGLSILALPVLSALAPHLSLLGPAAFANVGIDQKRPRKEAGVGSGCGGGGGEEEEVEVHRPRGFVPGSGWLSFFFGGIFGRQ